MTESARPAAGVARAFVLLLAARAGLKLFGFRRTVRTASRLARRGAAPSPVGSPVLTARTVATAAAFFPGRAVCLEQSLALYVILRRAGHAVTLRIGVQPFPFQAHAWIEVEGRPLFEPEETDRKFVMLPEVFA